MNKFSLIIILVGVTGFYLPNSCGPGQYYDTASLSCQTCAVNQSLVPSADGFSCKCNEHSIVTGPQQCRSCNATELVSSDGLSCVPRKCQNTAGRFVCRKCPSDFVSVTKNFDGSPMKEVICVKCARGFKPLGNVCVRCESCTCNKNQILVRGMCLPKTFVNTRPKYEEKLLHPQELLDIVKFEYLCTQNDMLSCHTLSNKCVKNFYSTDIGGPCRLWLQSKTTNPKGLPALIVSPTSADRKPGQIQLSRNEKTSLFLLAAVFTSNGRMKILDDSDENINQCSFPIIVRIGTDEVSECQVNVTKLMRSDMNETLSPYLYIDGVYKQLPVIIRKPNGYSIQRGIWSSNKFTRFFLVHNTLSTTYNITNTIYLRTMVLRIRLEREKHTNGSLRVDIVIEAEYAMKSPQDDIVAVTWKIEHEMPSAGVVRGLEIWGGILGTFLTIYALAQWRGMLRRGGLHYTIVPILAGSVADILYFAVLFSTLHALAAETGMLGMTLPLSRQEEKLIKMFIYSAFSLKALKLVWINWKQCTYDIFFLDWSEYNPPVKEMPFTNENEEWKATLLAKEWSGLQTLRRAHPGFTVTIALIVIHLLTPLKSKLPQNMGYLWALNSMAWWGAYCIVLFTTWLRERFLYSPVTGFPKICTTVGFSLLVFQEENYAHYVHGRNDDSKEVRSMAGPLATCRVACVPQLRLEREKHTNGSLRVDIVIEAEYAMKSPQDDIVAVTWKIEHEMPSAGVVRGLEIWGGILGTFLTIYALAQWRGMLRRGGLHYTIVPILAGSVADILYFAVLFSTLHALAAETGMLGMTLPLSRQEEKLIKMFIYSAFSLKALKLVWINWKQCTYDIFFLDWSEYNPPVKEMPFTNENEEWKATLLAKEWSGLQTLRRAHPGFTVTIALIVIHLLTPLKSKLPQNMGYLWALNSMAWWGAYCIVLFTTWLRERFLYSPVTGFPKICTTVGFSLLVFQEENYAHYVHGRNDDSKEVRSMAGPLATCRVACVPQLRLEREKHTNGSLRVDIVIEAEYAMKSPQDDIVAVTWKIEHEMPSAGVVRGLEIWGGILGTFLTIYALAQWRGMLRRGGLHYTIVPILAGSVADILYFAVLFSTLHALAAETGMLGMTLPLSRQEEKLIKMFIYSAFSLKALKLVWINWKQCTYDIFFLDWSEYNPPVKEMPFTNENEEWKATLLAKEWSGLQTLRRAHPGFTVTIALIVIHLLTPLKSKLPQNMGYLWALNSMAWWGAYCIVLFTTWLRERFLYSPVTGFPKICTTVGFSLLVFQEENYAHYVHGRNDDSKEVRSMAGPLATCRVACVPQLRSVYKQLSALGPGMLEEPESRQTLLSKFLAAFFERALDGLNWVASERTLFEKLLDIEVTSREGGSTSALLYDDDTTPSCFALTWWGEEWTLSTFDAILFSVVFIATNDTLLAVLLTIFVWQIMKQQRQWFGNRNQTRKTGVEIHFQ